jgi:putative hydrolase of the HAD superfamily
MIRAIFFDLDGTLIDRAGPWQRCVADFLGRHPEAFSPEAHAGLLLELAGVADSPFLDRRMVARVVSRRFPALGMTPAAIASDLAERLPGFVEPDPAVLDLVRDLSGRYKTAIVSNGSRRIQRAKLDRAGLAGATGRVFISGEMGVRKPEPELFRRVLDWAGVAPEDALIVGDHPHDDIFGGQRAGLMTCAVGGRYGPTWRPQPDLRIGRVVELPGVLG